MKYIANPVEVDAEVIAEISGSTDDGGLVLTLGNGSSFVADKSLLARMQPTTGDYVVKQSDGYIYLNPKGVFERKYRPAIPGLDPMPLPEFDAS